MYVYVIAYDMLGPCKIGKSAEPEKRLLSLQTGCPNELKIYLSHAVGPFAADIEKAAHSALGGQRTGGGDEWFQISVENACEFVRELAESHSLFCQEEMTLQKASLDFANRYWSKHYARVERHGGDEEEVKQLPFVGPLDLLAAEQRPPKAVALDFNTYVQTFVAGMWLRWAIEKEGGRWPTGTKIDSYSQCLRKQNLECIDDVYSIWIEWCNSRRLDDFEIRELADIWNKFGPAHTEVLRYRQGYEVGGVDDHVDDVWVHAIIGDAARKDRSVSQFRHGDFVATLRPRRAIALHDDPWTLRPILNFEDFDGILTAALPEDFYEIPIRKWLEKCEGARDAAFEKFLSAPSKRYPTPRKWNGGPPPPVTTVTVQLPEIDENGHY